MNRVLVADDEQGVRVFVAEALQSAGHDVTAVADGAEALAALREQAFDVLITDLRMPRVDGMTLVRTARQEHPDVEVIVMTAHGAVATAVEAMKLGAFDYLEKPISSLADLRALVARALERRRQLAPRREGEPAADEMPLSWGDAAMRPVVDAVQRVAPTSATVLLRGESGTGKEILARTIHRRSRRAGGPFVAINCAVLSENLLESELFGHEKGAFTGAHTLRRGRVELADGGSFFLDEVGDLQPSLQAKLLRLIEERVFERVGGSKPIAVDVRWIAATHRDLPAMVQAGQFRGDLYHRLAVFPIVVPPLRERPADLLPLAQALLARLAGAAGRAVPRLAPAAEARLRAASWPGNVRELRNALERALILDDSGTLGPELFADLQPAPGAARADGQTLESLEQRAIAEALARAAGNRREAAQRLGIGLRTLYEKLKRYDLK